MKTILTALLLCLGHLFSGLAWAQTESKYNLTQGVTQISQQVYGLHMLIFYICCAIAAVVFGIMFYSILRHRKSKGAVAANFHESTKVEILWTVIPIIILIAMAIPATKTLIAMEDTTDADLTIKITGSQWKWHYEYFGEEVGYYSLLATDQKQIDNLEEKGANYLLEVDRPLVLPINRKVRFLMTSDDVIHSWWVPDFAVKKDTIPGFINEAWTKIDETGVYRGQCAELCGRAHGFMPIVVHAMSEQDYDTWLAEQKIQAAEAQKQAKQALTQSLSKDELYAQGEQVYLARCAVCHQANGLGITGAFPAIKGSAIATGDVNKHIDILINGVSGSAMQSFVDQLSQQEIAAVITYQRNAWGNDTGDVIQAADINTFIEQNQAQEAP